MKRAATDVCTGQERPVTIDDRTRSLLVQRARSRKSRTKEFLPERPVVWKPWEVRNPNGILDSWFTDMTAWGFIADRIEDGETVEVVPLCKPKGAKGYVMKIELGSQVVYVKLQLTASKVVGRSFHLSKYSAGS